MKFFFFSACLFVSLLLLAPVSASAQRAVKLPIVPLFGKVPPPPASVKAAAEKAQWSKERERNIASFDKLFTPLETQAKELADKINTPTAEVGANREEIQKKMDDPEFKKKVKKMTLAEKMKLAEEMNAALGVGQKQMVLEPKNVNDALRVISEAGEESAQDFTTASADVQAKLDEAKKDDAAHESVDKWETDEIGKLPSLSTGEMSYKDPAKVRAVKLRAIDKHIALVDAMLVRELNRWNATNAKMTKRYTPVDQAIIATQYGDDARNNSSKTMLGSMQAQMVNHYSWLIGASKGLFEKAATWQSRKQGLLDQKE